MNDVRLFEFEEKEVRVQMIDDAPWWVAKDVCDVLGLSNAREAMTRIDDDEKSTVRISDGGPEVNIINESGLYSLILGSNKPEAKKFKKWITAEVLPSIRKTGGYLVGSGENGSAITNELVKQNKMIIERVLPLVDLYNDMKEAYLTQQEQIAALFKRQNDMEHKGLADSPLTETIMYRDWRAIKEIEDRVGVYLRTAADYNKIQIHKALNISCIDFLKAVRRFIGENDVRNFRGIFYVNGWDLISYLIKHVKNNDIDLIERSLLKYPFIYKPQRITSRHFHGAETPKQLCVDYDELTFAISVL